MKIANKKTKTDNLAVRCKKKKKKKKTVGA